MLMVEGKEVVISINIFRLLSKIKFYNINIDMSMISDYTNNLFVGARALQSSITLLRRTRVR